MIQLCHMARMIEAANYGMLLVRHLRYATLIIIALTKSHTETNNNNNNNNHYPSVSFVSIGPTLQ